MPIGISVSRLTATSHDQPDEVRSPDRTRVEVARLSGFTLGRFKMKPGWRWSECVKPVAGTANGQVGHAVPAELDHPAGALIGSPGTLAAQS